MKKASLYLMTAFYGVAGINHFVNPQFYYPLIPEYIGYPELINILSGFIEITLALGLISVKTRRFASYLIIAMLVAFIPSHVYFIQLGNCIEGGLCVPDWVGWARLLVIHPLLIFWAWSVSNMVPPRSK